MNRKQIKRLLALLKAEAELDRELPVELPENFKESFEQQPTFQGWVNYHVTWDVDDNDAWKVIPLKESKVKTWEKELAQRVPVITGGGEVVTPQQYEDMQKAGVETLEELEAANKPASKKPTPKKKASKKSSGKKAKK